jgi:hypothetical protein
VDAGHLLRALHLGVFLNGLMTSENRPGYVFGVWNPARIGGDF